MNLLNKAHLRRTASEIAMGRYMRAPDHDAAFEEFAAAGTVEVGETQKDAEPEEKPARKPGQRSTARKAAEEKPAAAEEAGDDDADDDDDSNDVDENAEADGDEGDDADDKGKKKPDPKENQINRLKREKRELAAKLRAIEAGGVPPAVAARLDAVEKLLQGGKGPATQDAEKPAPDPSDTDKYPLGHLDDRYIEDKLDWLAEKKATERADAVLQRQQETEQTQAAARQHQELLGKVDDLAERGSELFEDFQESVVESGMRGDWDLSQATFEAAHEAEHGAQILYDLSQDPKEASRVAKLSSYAQMKFVMDRDAEIATGKKPRTKPAAGEPANYKPRGANSRTQISSSTDNLDDFEKAWLQDEKKKSS